jgi:hypothetical protein
MAVATFGHVVVVSAAAASTLTGTTYFAIYPCSVPPSPGEAQLWKELETRAMPTSELLAVRNYLRSTGQASA